MQAPCWEATDFVLNLRSVLNKYPLGTQPCAYNYSDGKDYKTFFVFIAYDDGNDFTQTHLCIRSVWLCSPQLLKKQIAKHMTVCCVTAPNVVSEETETASCMYVVLLSNHAVNQASSEV